MLRTGSLRMFNSIGVMGLLVLAGVLLTTATAPANAWRDSSVTDYAQALPDISLSPRPPTVLHRTPLTSYR